MAYIATAPVLEPSFSGQLQCSLSRDTVPASTTLEPTTGPLALQGVGLPTSHCLEQISSDPAFAERAAKYSPFNNGGEYSQPLPFVTSDPGKSRAHVAGCTLRTQPESESKMSRSTSSTRSPAASTKRYKAGCAAADGKGRLLECFPPEDGLVMKSLDKQTERSSSESNSGDSSSPSAGAAAAAAGNMRMKENVKALSGSTEPAASKQDYVHVRARRGQATDSHSLAERVRREKISERMKYLQELVPGCSKVTGKAVMLDEIINYVQSLQQQVEFLSMKLAAVNPQLDFNLDRDAREAMERFVSKEKKNRQALARDHNFIAFCSSHSSSSMSSSAQTE
ncbi:unnamed protein product [Sphagnum jensenii]|uniref:BHLH domain-containing protein n=1 Tax=Sphagnum jensenii TaxID=128206 RepID=A0ABP0XFI6_9BRYO